MCSFSSSINSGVMTTSQFDCVLPFHFLKIYHALLHIFLHYVLRGVKCSQTTRPRVRLPITSTVLEQLRQVWSKNLQSGNVYEARLLWDTACLAFFGFFQLSEILPTSSSSLPPLLLKDIQCH